MNHLKTFLWLVAAFTLGGCASSPPVVGRDPYTPDLLRGVEFTQVALTNAGNGQWLVHASINGEPGIFAVDTGADYTLVTPEFARKAGLLADAKGSLFHKVPAAVRVADFRLGDFDYNGFDAPIVNLDHINRAARTELAGVLGNNLLRQTACTMNWRNNTLTLDARELARPANALPIALRGNRIFLTALVNGQTSEFALDTGAYRSLLAEPELARLKVPNDRKHRVNALRIDINETRQVKQTEVTLDSFKAGAIERPGYPMLTWTHNVLGMDLLEPWVLTFDARGNWMTLSAPMASGMR